MKILFYNFFCKSCGDAFRQGMEILLIEIQNDSDVNNSELLVYNEVYRVKNKAKDFYIGVQLWIQGWVLCFNTRFCTEEIV